MASGDVERDRPGVVPQHPRDQLRAPGSPAFARCSRSLILSDRMQRQYTRLMCDLAEQLFTVTNPDPKPGFARLVRHTVKARGVRWRDLARDGLDTLRVFR